MNVLIPLVVLCIVLLSDRWVYFDATKHLKNGETIELRIGQIVIATPEAWLIGCLLLWVVFFPAYLVARDS